MTRLFSGAPLAYSLATIANRTLDTAANLPPSAWAHEPGEPPADIAAQLAASVALTVPVVEWEARTLTTAQAPVTVNQGTAQRPAYIRVPGLVVVASYPFTGSSLLMTATPSARFTGGFDSATRATPLANNTGRIEATFTGRHIDPAELDTYLAKVAADVKAYLEFVRADLAAWERSLSERLAYTVGERAAFHAELAALAEAT